MVNGSKEEIAIIIGMMTLCLFTYWVGYHEAKGDVKWINELSSK